MLTIAKERKVLDFHKIRKYVSRSGTYIGVDKDSQSVLWERLDVLTSLLTVNRRCSYEHLMIIYYDALLIDDESLLATRHSERFRRLSEIITLQEGHAELVEHMVIDFAKQTAASHLRMQFAKCITSGGEGLVLKPDDPYVDFDPSRRQYSCCNIKLKKEYIGNFGDVGDFAVIGAHYDSVKAKRYNIPNLKWTHFFIGCLENPVEARQMKSKPSFFVTNVVELTDTQLRTFLSCTNVDAVLPDCHASFDFRLGGGPVREKKLAAIFQNPPVFDLRCFSFDCEPSSDVWSLRFPTVSKIHFDRTYLDCISFAELQEIAKKAKDQAPLEDSQEMVRWISALQRADPRGVAVDAVSQLTETTMVTSPPSSLPSVRPASPLRPGLVINTDGPAPLTPPRSSAATGLPRELVLSSNRMETADMHGKRRRQDYEEDGRPSKAPRLFESPRAHCREGETTPRRDPTRNPLAEVSFTSSPRNGNSSPSRSRTPGISSFCVNPDRYEENHVAKVLVEDIPSSATASFYTAPTGVSPRPSRSHDTPRPRVRHNDSGSKSAKNKDFRSEPPVSVLGNCSVLLSPCISTSATSIRDALKPHGIVDCITDIRIWKAKSNTLSTPVSSGSSEGGAVEQRKSRWVRKICLVESRNVVDTENFLELIEGLGLVRPSGGKEYVEIYDWRVLGGDAISGKHGNIARAGAVGEFTRDALRKYWVGLA